MLRGVEWRMPESRNAKRRATTTDDVCTLPAALVGTVATFVLAVTQPATDDANATSTKPVEIRRLAVTHTFGMRDPPLRRTSIRLTCDSPTTSERSRSWQRAGK